MVQVAGRAVTDLLRWARRNPLWSRLWIKLALRLGLALSVVPVLQTLAETYGFSVNLAAVAGVVAALLVGTVAANRLCDRLGIPPAPRPG